MNPTSATESSPGRFTLSDAGPKDALDAHAHGEMDAAELTATLLERCREDPEETWDALSLLDQYHRRGLLDTKVFLAIRNELHTRFFGLRSATHDEIAHPPASDVAVADPPNGVTLGAIDEPKSLRTAEFAVAPSVGGSPHVGAVLLDRYVLVAPIVSTFATHTFKAFDRQRAGLPQQECYVSIKCLRDEFANSAAARDALNLEFTLARNLSHPNILKLYEFHQDDDACFIVMEWMQGQLLTHVLERFAPRPIARLQALAIVREIGLALAGGHREGVSHTHLSPDTVSILSSGDIRVFGFAAAERRLEGISPDGDSVLTGISIDRWRSTPSDRHVDVRDDLFSLGCVAYHLLSGHAPFIDAAGTIVRKWRRIPTLPSKQWRAIEQAITVDGSRRSPEIRDWLAAFDSNAALSVTPLNELRPGDVRTSGIRSKTYGVGLAMLVGVLLGMAWITFSTQPMEFQPFGSRQAYRPIPPDNTSSLDMTALPDGKASQSSGDANAVESTSIGLSEARTDAGKVASTVKQDDLSADKNTNTSTRANTNTNTNTNSAADERMAEASRAQSVPQVASAAKPTSVSTQERTNTTAINAPTVGFIADQYVVNEGETTAKITLRRAGSVREESLIYWRTQEGSAKAHQDFVPTEHGAAIFPAGVRSIVILVPIVQGEPRRFSVWFAVDMEPIQNAQPGTITSATVFIVSARFDSATEDEN